MKKTTKNEVKKWWDAQLLEGDKIAILNTEGFSSKYTETKFDHLTPALQELITKQFELEAKNNSGYTPLDDMASSDDENPNYMLQGLSTALLLGLANGEINAVELAKTELRARGLDIKTGAWIGFEKKGGNK